MTPRAFDLESTELPPASYYRWYFRLAYAAWGWVVWSHNWGLFEEVQKLEPFEGWCLMMTRVVLSMFWASALAYLYAGTMDHIERQAHNERIKRCSEAPTEP